MSFESLSGKSLIKHLIRVTILYAAVGMVSCGDDGVSHQESTPVIWPLAIGNSWTSERLATDSLGDTLWMDTCTISVVSCSTIDSEIWFGLIANCGKLGRKTNRNDGLWTRMGPDELYLTAKYPAEIGEHWIDSGSTTVQTVVATDTVITVPAGTFSCYGYREGDVSGSTVFGVDFYSPDIGMVMSKQWLHGLSGNYERTNRLIDFDLKPK